MFKKISYMPQRLTRKQKPVQTLKKQNCKNRLQTRSEDSKMMDGF